LEDGGVVDTRRWRFGRVATWGSAAAAELATCGGTTAIELVTVDAGTCGCAAGVGVVELGGLGKNECQNSFFY
jgi:hypothetical protein